MKTRKCLVLIALCLAAACPVPAIGAEDQSPALLPAGLQQLGEGLAAEVLDGQTLRLADGRVVRLAGIQAPRPPLSWPVDRPWRRAAEATEALAALVEGSKIRLFGSARQLRTDRRGRLLAQVTRSEGARGDGMWLQGALLSSGMAFVYTAATDAESAAALYAAEEIARLAGRGIWGDPYYAVRCAGEMDNATDATRVVQGRILAVAEVRGALYLNFAADWRSDFTIRVERGDRRRLGWRERPLLLEGEALEGALVEVRGWVYWFNGPAIDLDHGARLRRLTATSPLVNPACRQAPESGSD
jgi:endonuclease YncB( thermonuclease family)